MQWYFLKHPPRCQQFASEPKGLPLCSLALGVFNSLSFSSSPQDPGKILAKAIEDWHSHLWRQHCSSCPAVYFHLPGAPGVQEATALGVKNHSSGRGCAAAGLSPGSTPHSEKVCLEVFLQWHLGYGKPGPWRPGLQNQLGSFTWNLFTMVLTMVNKVGDEVWEAQILGEGSVVGDCTLVLSSPPPIANPSCAHTVSRAGVQTAIWTLLDKKQSVSHLFFFQMQRQSRNEEWRTWI